MESTILCMLTSTLCLFTWAFSSMAAEENVTHPTNNISNFNLPMSNMSNSTVYPMPFNAFSSMAAEENVTHPTNNISNFNLPMSNMSNSTVYPMPFNELSYDQIVEECWKVFNDTMLHIKHEYWCSWERVVSIYSMLQICLEYHAEIHTLAFPNKLAHGTILKAHMHHFKNCSFLSEELLDPPENILLGLIFAPICILPFLVTLVVYKSNTSKPQT